jgi:hypothetical protein
MTSTRSISRPTGVRACAPSFATDSVSLFGAIDAPAQPSSARQSEAASAFPHAR